MALRSDGRNQSIFSEIQVDFERHRYCVLTVGRLSTNPVHWLSLCLLLICAIIQDRSGQEAERSPLVSWLTPNV